VAQIVADDQEGRAKRNVEVVSELHFIINLVRLMDLVIGVISIRLWLI
jgi:hypothetical protein